MGALAGRGVWTGLLAGLVAVTLPLFLLLLLLLIAVIVSLVTTLLLLMIEVLLVVKVAAVMLLLLVLSAGGVTGVVGGVGVVFLRGAMYASRVDGMLLRGGPFCR